MTTNTTANALLQYNHTTWKLPMFLNLMCCVHVLKNCKLPFLLLKRVGKGRWSQKNPITTLWQEDGRRHCNMIANCHHSCPANAEVASAKLHEHFGQNVDSTSGQSNACTVLLPKSQKIKRLEPPWFSTWDCNTCILSPLEGDEISKECCCVETQPMAPAHVLLNLRKQLMIQLHIFVSLV